MSTFGRGFSRHDIFLTLWSSFNVLLLLTLLHPLRKLMINSAKLSKSIAKFLSYSFYQWHYQKACGCIESVCCKRSITEHPEVHSHMEYKRSDAEHPELPVEVTTETAESKEIELSHRNRRNAISVTA
eukprot:617660_1